MPILRDMLFRQKSDTEIETEAMKPMIKAQAKAATFEAKVNGFCKVAKVAGIEFNKQDFSDIKDPSTGQIIKPVIDQQLDLMDRFLGKINEIDM